MTRHLSVNQVLNDDADSTSMKTAPYSSTPKRQTTTAAVHRSDTLRRFQVLVAIMLNRPASTTPSTYIRQPVTSTPSPNMSKGNCKSALLYCIRDRPSDFKGEVFGQ